LTKTRERTESTLEDELISVAESLIVKGKELGYLAPDDILKAFPEPDELFRSIQVFAEMGIEVTAGDKDFNEFEPVDDLVIDIEISDSVPFDDLVRMYLKEIGRVSLLSAAEEVVLAKAIEAGGVREALSLLTIPMKDAFDHLNVIDRTFPDAIENLALLAARSVETWVRRCLATTAKRLIALRQGAEIYKELGTEANRLGRIASRKDCQARTDLGDSFAGERFRRMDSPTSSASALSIGPRRTWPSASTAPTRRSSG